MSFDEQLERSLDALAARLRDEVVRQVREAGDELTAAAHSERAKARAPIVVEPAQLADGIRAIDAARTLTKVFDALIGSAGREAARVAVFLVRDDQYRGWRLAGFGAGAGNSLELAASDAGVLAAAARTSAAATGDAASAPPFANLSADGRCAAVPMAIGGQTVAVLYADSGGSDEHGSDSADSRTLNLESLEILGRHAARCLEAITAMKAARSGRPQSS